MNEHDMQEAIQSMRQDSAAKNKRGIAFIGASIVIWLGILIIQRMELPVNTRNLYSFFMTSLLMPLAAMITRILGIRMQNAENPLNRLGFLFTVNQMIYIMIAGWVYSVMPERMIMVLAMVFGGHLLPFAWLYISQAYAVSAIVVSLGALIIGCCFPSWVVAAGMLIYEGFFTLWLFLENRRLESRMCRAE